MSRLLNHIFIKEYCEHCEIPISRIDIEYSLQRKVIAFQNNSDYPCISITEENDKYNLKSGYFVGVDWISEELAIYIPPKLDKQNPPTDYLAMFFSCFRHPEIYEYTDDLYEIKFDEPHIEIEQQQDMLTPLLMMQFLMILKSLVRNGLKKSYYQVEANLNARVQGKILISRNVKNNIVKNKLNRTVCRFEEFGFNNLENKLLKSTLIFAQRYLKAFPEVSKYADNLIHYCSPAFDQVDDVVDIRKIKVLKQKGFYKDYEKALDLAIIIFKRFGYNITNIENQSSKKVSVPPFWINMPKLFELHVLALLKDKFGKSILFQQKGSGGQTPDFLLVDGDEKFILDAKYKPYYSVTTNKDDIWQLSGYARDKKLLDKLGYSDEEMENAVVNCVIIYVNQSAPATLPDNLTEVPINNFTKFYKIGISIPIQKIN